MYVELPRQRLSRLLFSVGGLLVAATTALVGTPAGIDAWGTARANGHPEPNTVVWLDAPGAPDVREHATPVVLDQRNQNFYPHVLVVRIGTEVRLPNNDRVFHNVFSFHDGKRFDLGLTLALRRESRR